MFVSGYLPDRGYRGAFGRDAKEGGSGTGVEGGGVDSVLLILNFSSTGLCFHSKF